MTWILLKAPLNPNQPNKFLSMAVDCHCSLCTIIQLATSLPTDGPHVGGSDFSRPCASWFIPDMNIHVVGWWDRNSNFSRSQWCQPSTEFVLWAVIRDYQCRTTLVHSPPSTSLNIVVVCPGKMPFSQYVYCPRQGADVWIANYQ